MEVFVAKFDYEKEREDLLSFKVGEKFRIASKADKKWWAAYSIESGDYGYVPSSYMQVRPAVCLYSSILPKNKSRTQVQTETLSWSVCILIAMCDHTKPAHSHATCTVSVTVNEVK